MPPSPLFIRRTIKKNNTGIYKHSPGPTTVSTYSASENKGNCIKSGFSTSSYHEHRPLIQIRPDSYFPCVFRSQLHEGIHCLSFWEGVIESTYTPQLARRYSHMDRYEEDFSFQLDPSIYSQ